MRINLTPQSLKQLLPATVINQLRQLPIWNLVIKVKFKHKRHSCQTHQFHYLTNTISWVCHEHCKGPSTQTFCIRDVRWTFLSPALYRILAMSASFLILIFIYLFILFSRQFFHAAYFLFILLFFFSFLFFSQSRLEAAVGEGEPSTLLSYFSYRMLDSAVHHKQPIGPLMFVLPCAPLCSLSLHMSHKRGIKNSRLTLMTDREA